MLTDRDDTRLRDVMRNAAPTSGKRFAHWFPGGYFLTFTKSNATLFYSDANDTRNAARICTVPRNGIGYVAVSDILDRAQS